MSASLVVAPLEKPLLGLTVLWNFEVLVPDPARLFEVVQNSMYSGELNFVHFCVYLWLTVLAFLR